MIGQFKPPYNESFQVPDPTVAQVLVEHNVTHTYTDPGEWQACCLPASSLGQPGPLIQSRPVAGALTRGKRLPGLKGGLGL